MKRYRDESGSAQLRAAMSESDVWLTSRISYIETAAALSRSQVSRSRLRREWPQFDVLDLNQDVAERAAAIAAKDDLRALDALHLASAEVAGKRNLTVAVWDRRLWSAARRRGLEVLPESL